LVHPVPAVPDERPALVAGDLVDGRADPRSPRARRAVRLDAAAHATDSDPGSRSPRRINKERRLMRRMLFAVTLASAIAASSATIAGFCGFYVGKADTKLFNRASQVVLVRDGDRTVMTMASDFQGDLKEFAIVIPVPTFL